MAKTHMSDAIYDNARKMISMGGNLDSATFLECNDQGQSLLDLAILNDDYLLVREIVRQLELKKDDSLRFLLTSLHKDDTEKGLFDKSPLNLAAKLKNPQIFEYLLQLNPGFDLESLKAAKQQRKKVRAYDRRWGMIVALFKSACPSKSLADAMNLPELVVGLGFTLSAGLLAAVALPASIIGLGALACITFARYQKLKVEQNIAEKGLDTAILQAQLIGLEKKLSLYNESDDFTASQRKALAAELEDFQTGILSHKIIKTSLANKKHALDFLTTKDKIYRNITTAGEILCTNLGILGLAAFIVASLSLSIVMPIVVTIIAALAVTAVTIFYIKNKDQQSKELAKMRRAESQVDIRLYKSLKNFMFNKDNGFLTALSLLEVDDSLNNQALALRVSFDAVFKQLAKDKEDNANILDMDIETAVTSGNRRQFKRLIARGIDTSPYTEAYLQTGETLLHSAVQAGNLLIVEEMLGLSLASKMRTNKRAWVSTQVTETATQHEQWVTSHERHIHVLTHYETLMAHSKQMLLLPDKKGFLPLHIAAGLKDPALYYMLLKQPVLYPLADLEKAYALRNRRLVTERRWARATAVVESICPGSSIREIFFSASFVALALSSAAVSLGVGVVGAAIFGIVVYSNYQKSKIERGITADLEQIAYDKARITHIQLKLQDLQAKINNAEISVADAQKEQDRWMYLKRDIRKNHASVSLKPIKGSLMTRGDKINASISAVGAFLCAYAGTLGLIKLAITTFALTLTGPVGWGLLIGAAVVGLVIAGVFVHNRQRDLSIFAERRQNVILKKEGLFIKVDALSNEINSTLNIRALQQSFRVRQMLDNHQDGHPNCRDLALFTAEPNPSLGLTTEAMRIEPKLEVTEASPLSAKMGL